jgi:hypothetical protein
LDEVVLLPAQGQELIEGELSGKMVEKKLNSTPVEFDSTVQCQVKATEGEIIMGDQNDLLIDMCEEKRMQQRRLYRRI